MSFWSKLFSVRLTNDHSHKIVNILGMQFLLKRPKQELQQECLKVQDRFKQVVNALKTKNAINITFMVVRSAWFSSRPFLDYLLTQASSRYKAKVLIIPDFRFGVENARNVQQKCYEELTHQYGSDLVVLAPVSSQEDNIDIKSFTDIMFCHLPYNGISHPKYCIENLIKLNILPVLVNYGYIRSKYDRIAISTPIASKYWKIFVENQQNLLEYHKHQLIEGANCVVTGYLKMDHYAKAATKRAPLKLKTIMIAPHHSLQGGYNATMHLANFPKYADLFLQLPQRYPDINWIFRPHPALFMCLAQKKFWGKAKVQDYIDKMKSIPNVKYSDSSDYFADFAASDALIQDCGSFLVEYFYTRKPQLYLLKDQQEISELFSDFGRSCLSKVYQAFNKEDIMRFIDDVVIKGQDVMLDVRERFAKDNVTTNYPNVSRVIEEYFNTIFKA